MRRGAGPDILTEEGKNIGASADGELNLARLSCPSCRTPLTVSERTPGTSVVCPKCGRRLRIASPAAVQEPVVDATRYRRGSGGASRLPLALAVGAAALLALAGVAAYLLWGRSAADTTTSAPPEEQTAQTRPDQANTDKADLSTSRPSHEPPPKQPAKPPSQPSEPPPAPPFVPVPPTPAIPETWKESALTDLPPGLDAQVLDKINAVRKAADLPPVALDADASKGCAAHAAYLARNAGRIAALHLSVHAEDAALSGQSEAGRKAGETAVIAAKEPKALLDEWAALPAHRALLLHPKLMTIGVGFARNAQDQWASVFLWPDAAADVAPDGAKAVFYPAGGQTDAPSFFPGFEAPDPLPEAKEKGRAAGFPITVTFPPAARVKDAGAYLEDEAGKAIDAWLSSSEKPANDRAPQLQRNTVCLIAKTPLDPGVRYLVVLKAKVDGRDWQAGWIFLTTGPEALRRDFEDRFVARVNAARTSAGLEPATLDPADSAACAAHARFVSLNFPAHPDMNRQAENADWPGFSEEGKRAAARCVCMVGGGAPEGAADLLLSSLGARSLLLEPKMNRIALGSCWVGAVAGSWVLTFPDVGEGAEVHPVILYPLPDQKGVGTTYGAEAPSAVPEEAKGRPAGLPVTASFPWHKPLDKVTGRLTDAAGKEVEIWLSTPQKPLTGVPLSLVTLLPREPLREGETYTATVTADFSGEDWKKSWSFTTKKRDDINQTAVQAKALKRVNEIRKQAGLKPVEMDAASSRGCLAHAHYLVANDGRPALQKLGVQNEDAAAPGATVEGAKAAKSALVLTTADPADAVDGWVRTLFHRLPLLDPGLTRVGFGCAQYPNEAWSCVMDVQGGK